MTAQANAISFTGLRNVLGLFTEEGDVKIDELSNFLDLSKKELAQAFGVSPDALRTNRIARATKARLSELASTIEYVAETFNGDIGRTKMWINTPNPFFGGSTPKTLILKGRHNKVARFVFTAKDSY